jgi:hypothetical protein
MVKFPFEVDSGERDPALYPTPNDYTFKFNRPLYNVSSLRIVSGSIPKTQLLINSGNKYLNINGSNTVVLTEGTWDTGNLLANTLTSQLVNFDGRSNSISVSFSTVTSKLTFTGTTAFSFKFLSSNSNPAEVFGFSQVNTASNTVITSPGVVNLTGPASLVLAISSGAENFIQDVYSGGGSGKFTATGRFVFGHINIGNTLYLSGNPNEKLEHLFYTGNQKVINDIRLRFFYTNGSKLVPYDFGNRNHMLKFEAECAIDKLESAALASEAAPTDELPAPVAAAADDGDDEEFLLGRLSARNKIIILVVCLALFFGLFVLCKI